MSLAVPVRGCRRRRCRNGRDGSEPPGWRRGSRRIRQGSDAGAELAVRRARGGRTGTCGCSTGSVRQRIARWTCAGLRVGAADVAPLDKWLGCRTRFAIDVRLPLPVKCPDCGGDVLALADIEARGTQPRLPLGPPRIRGGSDARMQASTVCSGRRGGRDRCRGAPERAI